VTIVDVIVVGGVAGAVELLNYLILSANSWVVDFVVNYCKEENLDWHLDVEICAVAMVHVVYLCLCLEELLKRLQRMG